MEREKEEARRQKEEERQEKKSSKKSSKKGFLAGIIGTAVTYFVKTAVTQLARNLTKKK